MFIKEIKRKILKDYRYHLFLKSFNKAIKAYYKKDEEKIKRFKEKYPIKFLYFLNTLICYLNHQNFKIKNLKSTFNHFFINENLIILEKNVVPGNLNFDHSNYNVKINKECQQLKKLSKILPKKIKYKKYELSYLNNIDDFVMYSYLYFKINGQRRYFSHDMKYNLANKEYSKSIFLTQVEMNLVSKVHDIIYKILINDFNDLIVYMNQIIDRHCKK